MKKALTLLGAVVSFGLVVLTLAISLGVIGPTSKEKLPGKAMQAMEEYCALVANVKNPEDVKAVEAQEPQLRAKAIDVSTQYVHAIQQNKAPRLIDEEALEKFTPLYEKFKAETERYDGLQKRSVSSRPKR